MVVKIEYRPPFTRATEIFNRTSLPDRRRPVA
jgi:hypothetical protein